MGAMASYVGKLTGYYPDDVFDQAKCDEVIDGLTDVADLVTDTMQERDPNRKIQWRQHLISSEGRMSMFLNGLETMCKQNGCNGYMVGPSLTVGDFAVWRVVGWLSSGVIDGIPKDYVQRTFPNVFKVYAGVDAHPKVNQWKAKHPHHYKRR